MNKKEEKKKKADFVKRIFRNTGSSYDSIVEITTFWQDRSWKKRILKLTDLCDNPKEILDLACGTGIVTLALAEKFPHSRVAGIDLQEEYLTHARAKQLQKGIRNAEFYQGNAEDTNTGVYDLITASYLPKYVDMDTVIRNCSHMMRTGGLLIFHDFVYPEKRIFQLFYEMYWFFLRPFLWVLVPWREVSRELKRVIVETAWLDEMQKALIKHGFINVRVEVQRFQVAAIVYARKG